MHFLLDPSSTRWLVLAISFASVAYFLHRSGGRLAPRLAIAPVVFLATRPAVLVTWTISALAFAAYFLSLTPRPGHEPLGIVPISLLSLLVGGGLAVVVVAVPFVAMRAFAPSPKADLEPGEIVKQTIPANHFLRGEGRGGKLLVTSQRLVFVPHRFNVQLELTSVAFSNIVACEIVGERLLAVSTRSGEPHWIITNQPARLADVLTEACDLVDTDPIAATSA